MKRIIIGILYSFYAFADEVRIGQLDGSAISVKIKIIKISKNNKNYFIKVDQNCNKNECLAYKAFLQSFDINLKPLDYKGKRPEVYICQNKLGGLVVTTINKKSNFDSFCSFKDHSLLSLNSIRHY